MSEVYSDTGSSFGLPDVLRDVAGNIVVKKARSSGNIYVIVDFDTMLERTIYPDGDRSDWRKADLSHCKLDEI